MLKSNVYMGNKMRSIVDVSVLNTNIKLRKKK